MKFKLLKLVPDATKIAWLDWRKPLIAASIALTLGSLALVATLGLNFGIDFRGGTLVEARFEQAADLGAVRGAVGGLGLGDVAVQGFGAPTDVLVRVESQGDGDAQQAVVDRVTAALKGAFPGVEIRRTEVVGPKVSDELIIRGIEAVVLAILAIVGYVWIRFEWQYSIGAVAALVHDVVMTIGLFALLQIEFNLASIAAILTIVGYSLNDTVVIYDRVRENLRRYKSTDLRQVIDLSVNETLTRTFMTSFTTLLALLALYFFGGEVLRGFSFAMIWGVLVGTYSTVFIAAPILYWLRLAPPSEEPGGDGPGAPSGLQFGDAERP